MTFLIAFSLIVQFMKQKRFIVPYSGVSLSS